MDIATACDIARTRIEADAAASAALVCARNDNDEE
jgi:hypothetical protein